MLWKRAIASKRVHSSLIYQLTYQLIYQLTYQLIYHWLHHTLSFLSQFLLSQLQTRNPFNRILSNL